MKFRGQEDISLPGQFCEHLQNGLNRVTINTTVDVGFSTMFSRRWGGSSDIITVLPNAYNVKALINLSNNDPFTNIKVFIGNKEFSGWVLSADLK